MGFPKMNTVPEEVPPFCAGPAIWNVEFINIELKSFWADAWKLKRKSSPTSAGRETHSVRRITSSPVIKIPLLFAYTKPMSHPNANMPRINRGMVYLGACLIAGIWRARERQVNVQVIPTGAAIDESVDPAHETYNRVFRKVPERLENK
jgi:hypothetical protein